MSRKRKEYVHCVHEINRNLLLISREIEDIPKREVRRNLFAVAHEISGLRPRNFVPTIRRDIFRSRREQNAIRATQLVLRSPQDEGGYEIRNV